MHNMFSRFLVGFFALALNFSLLAQSPFVGLVLDEIPNSGFTNGEKTYRLYAELTGGALTQIYGDSARPHSVVTTTTFFNQDLFGTHSNLQSEVNTGAYVIVPLLEYDTWATLGDSYNAGSGPTTVGDVGFTANLSGSSWNFGGTSQSDAAIFRLPNDSLCVPDVNGRVLLGQFTTDGVLSGVINLNGLDGNGIPWEENQIPIPQLQVSILGCTDSTAFNYDPLANTDDGSCIAVLNGCTDPAACNYNTLANTDEADELSISSKTKPIKGLTGKIQEPSSVFAAGS